MLFILVYSAIYLVGLFLTIISVASLGSSFVLLNSFLPLLVANHHSIRPEEAVAMPLMAVPSAVSADPTDGRDDDDDGMDEAASFINEDTSTNSLPTAADKYHLLQIQETSASLKLSTSISSKGIAIGYTAAVFVQIVSICIIVLYSKVQSSGVTASFTLPMRTVLFFVGLWWALFTIPTALWLRPRPGPPLPLSTRNGTPNRCLVGVQYVMFAWKSLWSTIKLALRLPQVLVFLLGSFLLSDGVATITGTAILFARTELELGTAAIALLSITAAASGIVGAFCWPLIGNYFHLTSIPIVLCCIFLFELIPLYGLLGLLEVFQKFGFIGLQQWWEIYPLGFLLGFIMGGISSYARSIYGSMIPPGMEAAFYALYAVTDKGSSVIGPAIVGRIIDATGSIRMAFWFLSVLMISPAPFFWFVDVDKGRAQGLILSRQCWEKELYGAET